MFKIFKQTIKTILKYALTACALFAGFAAVLTALYAIPNERIKENILASIPQMREEAWRLKMFSAPQSYLDGFTDNLIAEMQFIANPARPFEAAIVSYREEGDFLGIIERVAGGGEPVTENYARYWHGYAVWLRPALLFLNYRQTRIAMNIVFYSLAAAVAFLSAKRGGGWIFALPVGVALATSYCFTIPMCWQYFSVYLVALISSLYVLARLKDSSFINKLPFALFVTGAFTSFADFLTVPLVALGYPLLLALLATRARGYAASFKDLFLIAVKSTIAWGAGYAVLWFSKWVAADLFFNLGTLRIATEKVNLLTYGQQNYGPGELWWKMPYFAFEYAFKPYVQLAEILFAGTALVVLLRTVKRSELFVFLGFSMAPSVWYMVVLVHSYAHTFFTFRALSVTALSLACAATASLAPLTTVSEPIYNNQKPNPKTQ